ncbi:hypothetical protein P3X46_011246 [Hevea brasiliensis]|uniref:GDSL esterase/lipase 1-like n=1 Tax=Hevea brasiliensis TaxID=3981 RepID=A0ABQ9MGL5_HEVBR|nr:GDSL esterase/lipase 2 [Hevea brasiliensis]KAJ9179459.1 hypothetical protein P3X46_011246 [Hevea brasiliensis]
MADLRFHFHLWVFFASLLFQNTSKSHVWSAENHAPLFIFGDSLFDAGNNNNNPESPACYWPYGETFFKHPTGRASDGRVIPDFIAEYAKLPFIAPYIQITDHQLRYGVNFASGGAGVLDTFQEFTSDLKTQLINFKYVKKRLRNKLGESETNALLSKAIYLFSIGNNDYMGAFNTNSSIFQHYSREEYVGMVIGSLTTVLEEIYKNGGRKFGFVSLGRLGCLPPMRAKTSSGGCLEQVNVLVKLHNKAFSNVLMKLEKQLQGFKYSNFDFYKSLSERIKHPSRYGFKEAKSACCGTGPYRGITSCGGIGKIKEFELCDDTSEYLFFDSHPTEKADHQFAKLMWSGSINVTRPYNLKQLFQL